MSSYNFEGLWFEIYQNVIEHNQRLGKKKLDKNQLREVTTSIFIAETGKGVCRPESEQENVDYDVPAYLRNRGNGNGSHKGNGSSHNGNGSANNNGNGSTILATDNQIEALKKLINNPKVNKKEKKRIKDILSEPEVSKSTASEILGYFYGDKEFRDGEFVKVEDGVLDKRYAKQAA